MTSTLLKYNVVILILLFIGMTLIHNSSQGGSDNTIEKKKFDLYYTSGNPPCRSVLLTAKALGLEFNLINKNIFKNEHMQPEFIKLNPQHTLPTLVDDKLILWESRAIIVYLVETYGKVDDPLFPKDTAKRALINQRLQYDLGTLYPTFIDQYYMWIFGYAEKTNQKEKQLQEALGFLEIFLESSEWVAGDLMTLADISLVATISTFEVSGVDLKRHTKISKWLERCKSKMVGYNDVNQPGVDRFRDMVAKKTAESDAHTGIVTKNEVIAAIEVLKKAVIDQVIGEELSALVNKLETAAISVY